MKIGFISDAHGNPFGLRSSLERLSSEGAEHIYFLGDAFGYWPHGVKVAEELMQRRIPCIKGNHEAMALGLLPISEEKEKIYRLKPVLSSLTKNMKEIIRDQWPLRRELDHGGKKILLVHGRPAEPLEAYFYEDEVLRFAEYKNFDVIVMAHTHRPFVKYQNGVLLFNVGSCGLPREVGNIASCAIYDTLAHSAQILKIEIDTRVLLASCVPGSVAKEVIECLQRKQNN